MTIVGVAPRDFFGTSLGSRPHVYVPLTMRGVLQLGFVRPKSNGFENRRSYFAYLFARLKPGVSIEEATTGINVPYSAIVNDVEAPLQQGMSEQTMARFQGEDESRCAEAIAARARLHEEASHAADAAA